MSDFGRALGKDRQIRTDARDAQTTDDEHQEEKLTMSVLCLGELKQEYIIGHEKSNFYIQIVASLWVILFAF